MEPRIFCEIEKWAADEFRSVNAQIEYLLRQSLIKSGRLKSPVLEEEEPPETS